MKGIELPDVAIVVGLALLAAGLVLVAGVGWCLLVLGCLLLAGGVSLAVWELKRRTETGGS